MANYNSLKTVIQSAVDWDNNNNEISGNDILSVLLAIINSLGADYQFVGVAQPGTQPGTPDQNVAYIGGSGSYPNFNSANIPVGYIGVFTYNGAWTVQTIQVGGNYDAEIATLFSLINGYSLPTAKAGQITSGGNWNLAAGPSHYAIRVNPGDVIRMTGPALASVYTYWTLLHSYPDPIVAGNAVDYATGYGSGASFPYVRLDGQQDSGNITVPSNGYWLYVTKTFSTSTDRTPSAIYINGINIMENNGLIYDVNQLKQTVASIQSSISTINATAAAALSKAQDAETMARKNDIQINGYDYGQPIHGIIGSAGSWVLPAAGTTYHYVMKINAGDIVRVIGPTVGGYCWYTFLKSYPTPIVAGVAVDYATGYGSGTANFPSVQVAKQTDGGNVTAPSDAVYLCFSGVNASVDRTPSAIYINGGVNVLEESTGLEARVAQIESGVVLDYPRYFDDNVAAVIDAVQANNVLSGFRGDSFIFCTDNHFPRNFGYSPALAQAVANKSNNRIFIDGGDVFDGGGTKAEELPKFRNFFNNVKERFGNNFRYTYGNHDNNAANEDVSQRISDAELYAIGCKPYENDVTFGVESGNKKLYYYWDNVIQKIRYFVLNYHDGVSTSDAQYTWLQGKINELESGWHVFVFIHICVASSGGNWVIASGYESLVSMLESFGPVVVGVMCGHVHNDGIVYSPTLGFPIIACAQDFASDITQDNTINNACITFVDIDIDNELLRLVRLGRKPVNWGTNIAKTIPFRTTI